MKPITLYVAILVAIVASRAWSSQDTIGPNGIDSAGLTGRDGQVLNGQGVHIGQIEATRPGDPNSATPDDTAHSNINVDPAAVHFLHPTTPTTFNPTPSSGTEIDNHAKMLLA